MHVLVCPLESSVGRLAHLREVFNVVVAQLTCDHEPFVVAYQPGESQASAAPHTLGANAWVIALPPNITGCQHFSQKQPSRSVVEGKLTEPTMLSHVA